MTIKKTTTYTTVDGKTFMNQNEAIAHDQELQKSPEYIKNLPLHRKLSLIKYCTYVILIMKADIEIDNVTKFKDGFMGLTQLKDKVEKDNITDGFYLNETGEQINTLLSEVGLNIYYESDAEGRKTSLNAIVLDRENIEFDNKFDNSFNIDESIDKITKLLRNP